MKLLVTGATGGTGQVIVRLAIAQGHAVTALVRSVAKAAALLPGATLVEGDARDEAAILRGLDGCDAVISALGTPISPFREVTLLSEATAALVAAMTLRRVTRLVCITGVGAGNSRGHGGFFYDRIFQPLLLRKVYQDKDRQEEVVRASDLAWVIVRPTILNDKPATGRIRATVDLTNVHGGSIPRADVAGFVLDQLTNDQWVRKTPLITAS
ncbi:MAG: SDR family oxidoreductase [Sphingomonas sp.]|nr:SDR family oxidoreductase [Sphingomonas sp.]